jgi:hypothetical protein
MARVPAVGFVVKDVHSQLNETTVREVVQVDSLAALREAALRGR